LVYPSLSSYLSGASNLFLHDKWEDIIELNMTESSSSPAQSTTRLRSLQEILHNRIIQKKREIHKSHNRVYNDIMSICSESNLTHFVCFSDLAVSAEVSKSNLVHRKLWMGSL
jgi:hypothetical protein